MKVNLEKNGLLLVPETDFESEVLNDLFPPTKQEHPHIAFLKTGTTASEVIGLKIISSVKGDI